MEMKISLQTLIISVDKSNFGGFFTSKLGKYSLFLKVPRFKLESDDPCLGIRMSQWRTQWL